MQITLFGHVIPITRHSGLRGSEWQLIGQRLNSLNGIDAQLQQPPILALADRFRLIRGIIAFRAVQFGPHYMTRSFVDTATGDFYWHVSDLTAGGYSSPQRMMSYLLHDAQHVRQRLNGDVAKDLNSLVRREVDATDVQLAFAQVACATDPRFLRFLDDFRNDRAAIEARLKTGVGLFGALFLRKPRHDDHLVIF